MREDKWLLRKKSGSRNHYKHNWMDYERSDYKAEFQHEDVEEKFAKHEGMTTKNKSGIDTTLVKKWLYSQVGIHFDTVYAEFLSRVQPKYMDTHKECIYWYVLQPHELKIEEGVVYRTWRHIDYLEYKSGFYIHPDTRILCRVVEPKQRTLTRKEGKIKHAQYKTMRNQSAVEHKEINEKVSEKASLVMKEKKHKKDI